MGYYPRVRELREDHDLTQRQLAERLGLTQPQYCRYEQGYRDLPAAAGPDLSYEHGLYSGPHGRSVGTQTVGQRQGVTPQKHGVWLKTGGQRASSGKSPASVCSSSGSGRRKASSRAGS